MTKKILLATEKAFAKPAVDGIEKVFADAKYELVKLENYTDHADFVNAIKSVDGVIIRSDKANSDVINAANNLKIIVRAGAGFDNIDLEACTAKGVTAMNTPGQNSNAVAELALGMMVYLARNGYNGKSGTELRGKKIGIHAYGNVGYYVAQIAKGFGMEVYAFDPFVPADKMAKDGVKKIEEAKDLYKTCEYVSLHLPKTKETVNSINYELLSLMPEGACLINTARKEVVCEDSILKLFAERKDFRFATDVEGDKTEDMKQFAPRYFATPKKMGAQTEEANVNAGLAAARQIVNFFEKGDITFKVNK
ncbi:MAG TPA: 3-phosphoglycerate dehydrogenase [Candidatus Cloacimonadota bacterium]|jgi:D-3-phosphoglycerate dehydrogenase|nr:3-phosphoglycerate dehydrogenase [Candidatus Cloacimonadales bacterium]HPY96165.1 3-phosphoglycerate dehydrogenase [Candidatus Cloacimonadota bacterium]HQB41381.1 3-phosphoglycerate dehydrogenase [Candidatus Cloacimonadota bacterium]